MLKLLLRNRSWSFINKDAFPIYPQPQGTVWKDENGDGERNPEEKGYNGGKLFLGSKWQFRSR